MFHALSKIFGFLTQPYVWIFILMIWALFANGKHTKRIVGTAVILMYFFSNAFIVDEIIRWWEVDMVTRDQIETDIESAVVLGGGLIYDEASDRVVFGGGADRYMQALDIINSGKIERLLVSGGNGSMTGNDIREADMAQRFLLQAGIDEKNILVERESRNTFENAQFSAELIRSTDHPEKVLLITSAFHMRRAQACFERVGLEVQPYATGSLALDRKFNLEHLLVPHQRNLGKWDLLIHEFIGWMSYKAKGWL